MFDPFDMMFGGGGGRGRNRDPFSRDFDPMAAAMRDAEAMMRSVFDDSFFFGGRQHHPFFRDPFAFEAEADPFYGRQIQQDPSNPRQRMLKKDREPGVIIEDVTDKVDNDLDHIYNKGASAPIVTTPDDETPSSSRAVVPHDGNQRGHKRVLPRTPSDEENAMDYSRGHSAFPSFQFKSYSHSFSVGPDGRVKESKQYKDSDGRYEKSQRRIVDGLSHAVTEKRLPGGHTVINEDFGNVGDKESFDAKWREAAQRRQHTLGGWTSPSNAIEGGNYYNNENQRENKNGGGIKSWLNKLF